MDQFIIINLGTLFLISILAWAISAYTELLVWRDIKRICGLVSRILRAETYLSDADPLDYLIVEGAYKNRRTVVRISHFASDRKFFNHKLSLHAHIEPLRGIKTPGIINRLKNNLSESDKKILYKNTSTTSINTYSILSKISHHQIIGILEDLTYSVEAVEALT